jgi:hypothetical protein
MKLLLQNYKPACKMPTLGCPPRLQEILRARLMKTQLNAGHSLKVITPTRTQFTSPIVNPSTGL